MHQLSVINENFYNTGRKGILYISNTHGDPFRYGLENTFSDTYEIISSQPYIQSYSIYANEQFDINLSSWRFSPYVFKGTWNYVFKQQYNGVDWGKHKWLNCPLNNAWSDKVIINTSDRRFASSDYDFNVICNKYGKSVIFLSANSDNSDYNHFNQMTGIKLDVYYAKTFKEMCIIINSCKLFIGTLSGPLTIAHALSSRRIICNNKIFFPLDSIHIVGLESFWSNTFLSIDDEIKDSEKTLSETT
jgi:hypothetical protein